MSSYLALSSTSRRDRRIINHPMSVADSKFMELYDEISSHWREKAQKLQARRWRRLRHQDA